MEYDKLVEQIILCVTIGASIKKNCWETML